MTDNIRNNLITALLLLLIVTLGGYFRFMSLNWDDFASLHPDERFLTRNLAPLVGGGLEFTNDAERFPNHSILVNLNNMMLEAGFQLRDDSSLRVGAVADELSADVARWWVSGAPDERIRLYDSSEAAVQGIMTGDVAGIIVASNEAGELLRMSRSLRTLDEIASPTIQRLRCSALYPQTDGVGGYFDSACSSYNPYNAGAGTYAYGTFPLFLTRIVSDALLLLESNDIAGIDFQGETLVWRFFSALFDTGTIVVIFFIGRKMHNNWVGLLAAVLYAAMPLPIQKAHFGTVNAITAFWVALALLWAVYVQDSGRMRYYALFGIALGLALAGRINVIPLAGVVVLAGMINAAPALSAKMSWHEREQLIWRNVVGVFLAGITTIITFRIVNPYAFVGPTFFHMIPSMRWLADAQQSSNNVSGVVDIPPNWQWVNRASYLMPLKDMLLWGMGITAGAMAWVGFAWSGVRLARAREFATRNLLIFVWVLVYFAWIGGLWVMTMRYYLPLYSGLAVLAGWALYETIRQQKDQMERVMLAAFGAVLAIIPAYALYNGIALDTTLAVAGVAGVALFVIALLPLPRHSLILVGVVVGFTVLWGVMFTNIYRNQVTRIQAARWVWENVSGDLSAQIVGAPDNTPLVNIDFRNQSGNGARNPEDLINLATSYTMGLPYLDEFTAWADGTITHFHAPHLADPNDDPEPETLYVSISRMVDNTPQLLAETTLTANFTRDNHPLGDSYDIVFDEAVPVTAGERYLVKAEIITDDSNDAIVGSGAVMLTEGDWDDRITTIMTCSLPGMTLADDLVPGMASFDDCNGRSSAYSLLQSYDIALSYPEDAPIKRENMLEALAVGDYFAITSNRFYDTETRNPARFPLTTRFYDALFSGELGYELVASFEEGYEFAGLSVGDQHLPTYDSPAWLNELEADEAFHVYDHPAVFIFRKSDSYDHNQTELILNSVPIRRVTQLSGNSDPSGQIVGAVYWDSLEADPAPTALQFYDDMWQTQTEGGTWSQRFASDSLLNRNQALGVIVWWALIVVIGWLAFPLLFVALPRLADRGYNAAKIMGLFILGWVAWVLSSARVPVWNQGGLFVLMLVLALVSGWIVYTRRTEFRTYLREQWRNLLGFEILTLVLFLALIGVRLTNPDLWHHPMGGEKPMDFAYFNAVLRSTIFPAYDPWYAGGFINYYYVGYVIVGVPVLLLKIVPAFAYNLLVPTVFALTGMGAFSVAYNVIGAWRNREGDRHKQGNRTGNPWVAGIAALMLCVVLGNLDVPRVILVEGFAQLGGYSRPEGLQDYLMDQYQAEHAQAATGADYTRIVERAENANIIDNVRYEWHAFSHLWSSIFKGVPAALSGQPLPIGSNRWYWAPTRIMNETPGVGGNAINEMPAFTFIYGDLHAHMINMPIMLFVMAFILQEVIAARRDPRRFAGMALAVALGAASVGMMRAVNTWDYPTFMIFGIVGLGYAWWQRWRTLSRDAILHMLIYVGGFITLAIWSVAPYMAWYASIYNSVQLWEFGKTPFWSYFHIYGLFLFLIVSLFAWDTARWLRETHVRSLTGQGYWLLAGAGIIAVILLLSLIAAAIEYQVALIVMPLIIWLTLLFFRPDQSEAMRFVLVAIGLALALTLGVEVVVVAGDIGRQNTVFKFYIQAWLLLSVAGGAAFAWLFDHSDVWSSRLRWAWYTPVIIMLAIAMMFPIMAIRARMYDRFAAEATPLTLNGLDYMQYAQHWLLDYAIPIELESDYHIIRWLQENVAGTPVILEGRSAASEYRYNGRISINTGLPSVLGWNWHQRQQRTLSPLTQIVEQRERNVKFVYETLDIPAAITILRHYEVEYLIVSDMERSIYAGDALAKFDMMVTLGLLDVAFEHGVGTVYHVQQDELDNFARHHNAFFDALGLDREQMMPYAASEGLLDEYTPNDVDVTDAIDVLAEYDVPFIVAHNLPQLQIFAPEVYDGLVQLERANVLDRLSDTTSRRIYRVDDETLSALQTDDTETDEDTE